MARSTLVLLFALTLAGCGGVDDPEQTPQALYVPPDEFPEGAYGWERTLADGNDAGLQTAMTLDDNGNPMMAYLAYVGDYQWEAPGPSFKGEPQAPTPPSFEPPSFEPPSFELPDEWEDKHPDPPYELRFARWSGSTWRVEALAKVHRARGLSILQASGGQVLISYVDTDRRAGPEVCMQTHLKVAALSGGSWRFNTIDQSSAPTWSDCPDCGVCETVGEWSSMAQSPGGKVGIAYRKARYTLDIDLNLDSEQRFVEASLNGNTVTPGAVEVVKGGESPGFYGEVTYANLGDGNRAHLVYMDYDRSEDESTAGVWYASRRNNGWQTSEIQAHHNWRVGPNLQLLAADEALNVMAYVWSGEETNAKLDLVLLRSTNAGASWTQETILHDGRGGNFPSLAINDDGLLGVSYYQCGVLRDWRCDPGADGLMLSMRSAPGLWTPQLVDNDVNAYDGQWSALAFNGNRPVVAGRSAEVRGPGNNQSLTVYFGSPQ